MVTRENQTGLIRGDLSGASFDESASDDFLLLYQKERQRINLEREAEIEAREQEGRGKSFPEMLNDPVGTVGDFLQEQLENQVKDKLLGSYLSPLADVIELAERNRLKMQDTIAPEIKIDECGVSIESPFINYTSLNDDCKPLPRTVITEEPVDIPVSPFFNPVARVPGWEELSNPTNQGKTLTFAWKFKGWVSFLQYMAPGSGQTVQLVANNPLTPQGIIIRDIQVIIPANPTSSLIGVDTYSRLFTTQYLSPEYDNSVPIPEGQDRVNASVTGITNTYFATGFYRQSYWGVGRYNYSQQVNTPQGNQWFHNVDINYRADIQVGISANWFASRIDKPNHRILQFFESPFHFQSYDTSGGIICTPALVAGNPTKPIAKPAPPEPPPPPPRKKCDCMTNCCPQNQSELANLTRLLRLTLDRVNQIEKRLGTQVDVPLWDVDITKRGSNSGNKKPDNLFNHLKLINERIELALRVIGIHEVPLDVDQNASDYTGTIKMFKGSGNAELKKLGETLEKRQKLRVTHTSIMSYLDWVADSIHEKFGDFELTVKMPSSDMVEEKMRGQEIYYPDISTALTGLLQWTIDSNLQNQYATMMLSKALIESTTIKKMLAETAFQVDATADYLGYGYKVEVEEMPTLITLEAGIEKLVELLAPGKVKVRKHVLEDKQTPLEVQLLKLHEVTAITKAVHTVPTGFGGRNIASVVKTLLQASKGLLGDDGDSLEEYLEKLNKIVGNDEDPLELEIAE